MISERIRWCCPGPKKCQTALLLTVGIYEMPGRVSQIVGITHEPAAILRPMISFMISVVPPYMV